MVLSTLRGNGQWLHLFDDARKAPLSFLSAVQRVRVEPVSRTWRDQSLVCRATLTTINLVGYSNLTGGVIKAIWAGCTALVSLNFFLILKGHLLREQTHAKFRL